MKTTLITIQVGGLDTVNKELVKGFGDMEIRGQEETIQTTVFL